MEEAAYLNEDETKGGARMNPNHQVQWRPTRPEFAIRCTRSTSTSRGYHESWHEIVSRRTLDGDDLDRLDACGLLGFGQCYALEKSDTVTDAVPPVTIYKPTGAVLDVPPVNWAGEPITNSVEYTYHRYLIKRICDSGD